MRNKHWLAIADALRQSKPRPGDPTWDYAESLLTWERVRDAVADALVTIAGSPKCHFSRVQWIDYVTRE